MSSRTFDVEIHEEFEGLKVELQMEDERADRLEIELKNPKDHLEAEMENTRDLFHGTRNAPKASAESQENLLEAHET